MKLIEITKEQLNEFTASKKQAQFLQSWEWGEYQKSVGHEVFRYGVEEDGKIKSAFSVFKKSLPFGKAYLYIPRVELADEDFVFSELKKKFPDVLFARMEPLKKLRITNYELRKTIDVQARKTSIVDISRSEEDILGSFHQKTRYNIRLAGKKGVTVRVGTGEDFEKFWEIMQETNARDGFRLHSKEYYRKQLEVDFIELVVAEFEGNIVAGNVVSYFGDMASYLHGSSSNKFRNVMAPFAIQWFTMKRAREKGCKYYDLNGIDEKKWPGVTRFKRGFNGEELEYPGCLDVVFYVWQYRLYRVLRWGRRVLGKMLGR